jgi:hypothetical protein
VGGACAQASASFLAIRWRIAGFEPTNTAIMSIIKLFSHDRTSTIAQHPGASSKNFHFEARLAKNLSKSHQSEIQIEQM